MDHHEYQAFDPSLNAMTSAQHLVQVFSSSKAFADSDKWEIVGEWNATMTDCSPWLNGRHNGHRYDGFFPRIWFAGSCARKGNITTWTKQMKDETREYIEAQMDSYASRDMYVLIAAGVFPQPLSARALPVKVCP
ncbi:hypothetical protein EG329_006490 [Mollisiaceae sp. DMI_Dod_QoI]|nr:hypothetical protein EG329_006490 [Helotiales sp. DMI_Dod_QoI]